MHTYTLLYPLVYPSCLMKVLKILSSQNFWPLHLRSNLQIVHPPWCVGSARNPTGNLNGEADYKTMKLGSTPFSDTHRFTREQFSCVDLPMG